MTLRMVNVQVELPADVASLLGASQEEAATCLKQLALMELYRRGDIFGSAAAEILEISLWEFIKLLDAHEIPYFDATEEEFRQQVEAARKASGHHKAPSSPTPAP